MYIEREDRWKLWLSMKGIGGGRCLWSWRGRGISKKEKIHKVYDWGKVACEKRNMRKAMKRLML